MPCVFACLQKNFNHFFLAKAFVVSLASIILWTHPQPSVQSSSASATLCPSNRPSCHHCVTCCDPGMTATVITPAPLLSSSLVGSNTICSSGGRQFGMRQITTWSRSESGGRVKHKEYCSSSYSTVACKCSLDCRREFAIERFRSMLCASVTEGRLL